MEARVACELEETFERFSHPTKLNGFHFSPSITVGLHPLIDPSDDAHGNIEGLIAAHVLVCRQETFEQFVHSVPDDSIEPVGFELNFRRGKKVFATQSFLATSQFLHHVKDFAFEGSVIALRRVHSESGQEMPFEESRECAVRFRASPPPKRFGVSRWQAGLESERVESAFDSDFPQNPEIDLDTVPEHSF